MSQELNRNFTVLKEKADPPPYFLSYEVTEVDYHTISGTLGTVSSPAASRIHVVGNVRMDQLMQRPVRNRSEWMKELNLPPNIPLVAVATQPFPEVVQNQVVRWLKQVADADLPFIYLLKPHPYDRYDYSVFQRHPRVRVLKPQDHSNELLTYCDILATISSNMGIEAARFKKPVLVLQPKIPYSISLTTTCSMPISLWPKPVPLSAIRLDGYKC